MSSWCPFSVRTHVRDQLIELKTELDKNSYSDVIDFLVEFYRKESGKNE